MIKKPGIFASKDDWNAYNNAVAASQNAAAQSVGQNYDAANAAIAGSVSTAQAGLAAAQGGASNALAAQATNAAQVGMINTDAEAVRAAAANVSGIAGGMAQDTANLRGQAASLWGSGQSWFGTGQDILNLSPTAGGIAGEFSQYYASLSPESLVSFAASDAQRSVDNTRGQLVRTLSSMGVSPGSAAFGAALAKARQYEAALLAGVKTRARLLGIDKQGNALAQGMQMAISATGVGQGLANSAINATQAAGGLEAQRGGLEAQAGQLQQGAGQLAATGAQITTASANAVTSAQQAATAAYNSLASAQQTAADYYATQASSTLGLLQSGNSVAMQALFS